MLAASDPVEVGHRLANTDPGNAGWQRDLSISQEKLGDMLLAQGDLAGAFRAFTTANDIRHRLANTDPNHTRTEQISMQPAISAGAAAPPSATTTGTNSGALPAAIAVQNRR